MDVVSMLIAKNLNFDMARTGDVLFNQDTVITESFQRLAFAALQGLHKFGRVPDDSHSFATTSRDSLDQDWILHFIGLFEEILRSLIISVISGNNRYIGVSHDFLGFTLATHGSDSRWRRTDEFYSILHAFLSKSSVFGQESEARMQPFTV